MNKKQYIIISIICVAIGLVAFNSGIYYTKKTTNNVNQNDGHQFDPNRMRGFQNMEREGGRGQMQGRLINGEVLSSDDNSIVVKLRDGGSKIILLSNVTKFDKSVEANIKDVSIGSTVMITGEPNTDGSVTAERVQIK